MDAAETAGTIARSSREAPLVGRDWELAGLRAQLGAALAGETRLALIGGEAGIGKTALARALGREAAEHGALVLEGRCYDLAETPPYGPWLDLLDRYRPAGDLPPPPDALRRAGAGTGVASQAALFAAARDFFAAVAARRPLVLLLDDLHWADPASLDLLRALAQRLAALPLLLVVIYRAEEVARGRPLYALLPALAREADAARFDLRPLDDAAVRALLRARYGALEASEAPLVAYLQHRSEGNPFFIGELLRAIEDEGLLRRRPEGGWALGDLAQARVPPFLRQVIDGRLARLGEEARGLLAVAAVLGQEVPFALWAAVGEAADEALVDLAERAVEAHLLEATPDGAGVRFAHALIRQALYEGLLPPRRRVWHRRVAEALLALPEPDPDAVAYHFQRAGDERAAAWLVRAGERAERAYALLTAAEHFAAALALLEGRGADPAARGWLVFRLARLRRHATPSEGLAALAEAARLGAAAGDRALVALCRMSQGYVRCFLGDLDVGLGELAAGGAAYAALGPADRERLRATPEAAGAVYDEREYRSLHALWLSWAGRYAEAEAFVGDDDRPPAPGDAGDSV
ncbi:MAG TPA: AAA family ATPase, partial [Thermomicrobiales bacterium]|nr:AAA family ATPase [Thermomicrobiales bacterium]